MKKLYVSQYGDRFYANTLKELKKQIPGRVEKMYCDKKDGSIVHTGYVIGGLWLSCYVPYEKKQ